MSKPKNPGQVRICGTDANTPVTQDGPECAPARDEN